MTSNFLQTENNSTKLVETFSFTIKVMLKIYIELLNIQALLMFLEF